MKSAYLEKELPQFSSINEAIFYNKKKSFQNILAYPKLLEKQENVSQFLEESWNTFDNNRQKEILIEYQNSTVLSTFASIIGDSVLKNLPSSAVLLQFLFTKGFTLNKKDIKVFEKNNWLEYKDIDIAKCHVYEVNWKMPFLQIYNFFIDIKKILNKKTPSNMYMIEYYPSNLIPVLIEYRDLLPKKLYSKLLRELSNEQLQILDIKNFDFRIIA